MAEFRQRLSSHCAGLAATLRAMGQSDEAIQVARQNRLMCRNDPVQLYHAARALALCVPMDKGEGRRRALADSAVEAFQAAIAAGWIDADRTCRDSDLSAIRDRDDFRHLLGELFDRIFPADPFAP